MKRTYRFRSIMLAPAASGEPEKAVYDIVTERNVKAGGFDYDMESVHSHVMELGPVQFFGCRTWVSSLLIALMAIIILFSLIYGMLVIFFKADMGLAGSAGRSFAISMVLSFIVLWLALGTPAAIKKLKLDFVIGERGKGNWRIVDEDKWEHFALMLRLARERQEKEKNAGLKPL
jgi:hypothetical protein